MASAQKLQMLRAMQELDEYAVEGLGLKILLAEGEASLPGTVRT